MHTPSGPRISKDQVQAALRKIQPILAPDLSIKEYSHQILRYRLRFLDRVSPLSFAERPPSEKEQRYSHQQYESVEYRYRGLDALNRCMESGKPVCLVGWHHGAREHFAYAVMKAVPKIGFFTLKKLQFGPFVTHSTEDAGPLAVLQMRAMLGEGHPVFHYLDGPPTGRTVETDMLGHRSQFSLAPLRMLCQYPDMQIVPVTSRYKTPDEVLMRFYDPASPPEAGPDQEIELVRRLLSTFTENLRRHAPEQALVRMLPYREMLAKRLNDRAASKRGNTNS